MNSTTLAGCVAHDRRGLIRVVLLVGEVALIFFTLRPVSEASEPLTSGFSEARARESRISVVVTLVTKRLVAPVKDLAARRGDRRYPQTSSTPPPRPRPCSQRPGGRRAERSDAIKRRRRTRRSPTSAAAGRALTSSGEAMRSRMPTGLGSLIVRPRPRNGCNETHGRHRRENHEPIRRSRHEPLTDANPRDDPTHRARRVIGRARRKNATALTTIAANRLSRHNEKFKVKKLAPTKSNGATRPGATRDERE